MREAPESLRPSQQHPNETDVLIVRQGVPSVHHKIDQVIRLLEIRAFKDAQRVLRSASNDLLAAADQLDES